MRIPRSVRTAGLLLAAVLLGLLTVQGTYALWSAIDKGQPGTVQASGFTVNLTGAPSGVTVPMTLNGQSSTLALTTESAQLQDLTRGNPVYASIQAANASDAGGVFDIAVTASAAQLQNLSGGSLAGHLAVEVAGASAPSLCPSATNYRDHTVGYTSPDIGKGGSTVLCFRVTMSAAAPTSVDGNSVAISIPLRANQKCGVPGGCP